VRINEPWQHHRAGRVKFGEILRERTFPIAHPADPIDLPSPAKDSRIGNDPEIPHGGTHFDPGAMSRHCDELGDVLDE
jgi:hypothetical protein